MKGRIIPYSTAGDVTLSYPSSQRHGELLDRLEWTNTGPGYCTGTGTGDFLQLRREKKKVVLYYYAAMTNGKCKINTSVGFGFGFSRGRIQLGAQVLCMRACNNTGHMRACVDAEKRIRVEKLALCSDHWCKPCEHAAYTVVIAGQAS